MPSRPDDPATEDPRVDQAIADYLHAEDAGAPPDLAEFLARFPPDVACRLASFLDDHHRVGRLAVPLRPADLTTALPTPGATTPRGLAEDQATVDLGPAPAADP